jgi:hypothetical protein
MAKVKWGMIAEKLASRWKSGKIPRSYKARQGDSYYRIAGNVYGSQTGSPNMYGGQQFGSQLEAYNQSRPLQPGTRVRVPKPRVRYNPRRKQKAPTNRVAAPTSRPPAPPAVRY